MSSLYSVSGNGGLGDFEPVRSEQFEPGFKQPHECHQTKTRWNRSEGKIAYEGKEGKFQKRVFGKSPKIVNAEPHHLSSISSNSDVQIPICSISDEDKSSDIVEVFLLLSTTLPSQCGAAAERLTRNIYSVESGQVRYVSIHRSSASPRPPCDGTPSASVWPSPRQTPGPLGTSIWDFFQKFMF